MAPMRVCCPRCRSAVDTDPASSPDTVRCPACGTVFRREGAEVPERLSHYEIVKPLGGGGMGQVLLARDARLGRDVALKLLPREYAESPERLERFRREARLASALNHPYICTIHDIGEHDGQPFLVMELIEGRTLRALAGEDSPLGTLARLGSQVAHALAAAHAAGVVHRDIKPDNIMVRADGYVKIVDFGLARPLFEGPRDGEFTEPGMLIGTVRYMSPEQTRGEVVTGATDVFSLGVVLYELATRRHPFQSDTHVGILHAIATHAPVPPDRVNPEIPATLASLILRMLEKDARLRPSAADVAATLEGLGGESSRPPAPPISEHHTVGRGKELAELHDALASAAAGRGLFVCVSGEPGMGKTTVVEEFLAGLAAQRTCAVGRGRCSERLAGTEAYLPILEALESLLRGEGGDGVARTMKAVAPNWYVQVASGDDSSFARAAAQTQGASQERLKRELGALLQELSRSSPLVLFLDDVHWADPSTVDLLAYLGSRCDGLRVLLLLAYRPTDLELSGHPFAPLKLDLKARGVCHEMTLGFLTREDIERYLALEFPGHDFPADLAALLHARTEGSPLFMADLLHYLRDREVLVEADGSWVLGSSLPDLQRGLPESIRSMIRRKIDQLGAEDRRLLVAASVQGAEFDSAIVTEALSLDAADVEERLEALGRVHGFVHLLEERQLPDRTPTLRYGFVHVLYQNALFASLQPTRRAKLSAQVAQALEGHYGEKITTLAAELAALYEHARDPERAADYCLTAARNAVRVFANREAVALARRGLALLDTLPRSPERAKKEMALLITLGPPLKEVVGWTAPEVTQVYKRAQDLCCETGQAADLFPALWGQWLVLTSRGEVPEARTAAAELLSLAERDGDSGFLLQAYHSLTTTYANAGEWSTCLKHADRGFSLYDREKHHEHKFIFGAHDPGACCLGFASQSLWMLGYPDQAIERGNKALSLSLDLAHPATLALSHFTQATIAVARGDVAEVAKQSEACERRLAGLELPIYPSIQHGWSLVELGQQEEGLSRMREGMSKLANAPRFWRAYFHLLIADACGKCRRLDEAMAALDEAERAFGDSGVGVWAPELHRLRGVFLLAQGAGLEAEAEACIRRAIDMAIGQGAKSLELRAVMDLCRLRRTQGRHEEGDTRLAAVLGGFTEGLDTRDLREARALLDSRA